MNSHIPPPSAELEPPPHPSTNVAANALLGLAVLGLTETTPERTDASEYFTSPEEGVWAIKDRYGRELRTNIDPRFFTKTSLERDQSVVNLPPSALDELPESTYYIESDDAQHEKITLDVFSDEHGSGRYFRMSKVYASGDQPSKSEHYDRTAPHIGKVDHGINDVMGIGFFTDFIPISQPTEETAPLLDTIKLGEGIPTPHTLQKNLSEKWGIRTKLVSESDPRTGQTTASAFVEAFGEGAYPVGVGGTFEFYTHDVMDDDHMPGVIAGGQAVLDLLAPSARAISDTFSEKMKADPRPNPYDDLKWRDLTPAAVLLDSITSDIRKLYQRAVATDARLVPSYIASLESGYANLQRLARLPYDEGAFTLTVLRGFVSASRKLGLEDQAKNMDSLYRKYLLSVAQY